MEKKLYSKISIVLIWFLAMSVNLFSQTPPPVSTIGPATFAGDTWTVPVTVSGFTNVGNISMKINYDATRLIFMGLVPNSGLDPVKTVFTPNTDITGVISFSYSSGIPAVLADPTNTLFTLSFTQKPGGSSGLVALAFGTNQGDCDITPPQPDNFDPLTTLANQSTYFINGSISVPNPIPTITGPMTGGLPSNLGDGITQNQVYFTESGMTNYVWNISSKGIITAGDGTESITVTWTDPAGQQFVNVNYTDGNGNSGLVPTVLIINYYPFPDAINPASIPQFVDPLPHFAAGLRVNAKAGGNLLIKTVPVQQIALSTGTVLSTGTIDPSNPDVGKGNYAAYAISKDNGATFGPAMWPAQTIEAKQGFPLQVKYENHLFGVRYNIFNILADQTLMMNGYELNGDPLVEPYKGDIPMVVHLHGGEMPSGSDGGPGAWFTPGFARLGPTFQVNESSLSTYPNDQEATTAWYHPHDDGLTRINVYTGLAGYYFIRGADEETAELPGWSGDDKVVENTPLGKSPTFNGSNAYLPEIEIAVQDRMFNVKGELYWPVAPPNPEIHPFWTPEFVGDIMTVNGKSWPYLSVAPRKYRFRMLEGCNARFLDMWLAKPDGTPGPKITVIGGEGGLLANPIDLDPATGGTLLMAPGQRYDVVVDFTGIPDGTTFILMNKASAPYPSGDPVIPGITDRIMQFVVNGKMVLASNPTVDGTDKSQLPGNLRPVTPLVKLTDFEGSLASGVVPAVKRQIILNEVSGAGGPAAVLVNNSYFDGLLSINPNDPYRVGGPTEIQTEGATETFSIINISADAHPIHIHLLQWQLVSRQAINADGYMAEYANVWATRGIPEFPAGLGYPGGAGTPFPYDSVNTDGAIGGNPSVGPFLLGLPIPANPEERGWKDNIIVLPGEVTTFVVRVAPTNKPVNAPPEQLLFSFNPSLGPGYVWHCHIVDHEDMSMMRPLMIQPSPIRLPQISAQPAPVIACNGDVVSFAVAATSLSPVTYLWQFSNDGGTTWTDLTDGAPYSGVTTATLGINTAALALTSNLYHCILTNIDGAVTSNSGLLTVNDCSISGTLKYNNSILEAVSGMTITIDGKSANTNSLGEFIVPGVRSGVHTLTFNGNGLLPGAINSTDAGEANYWGANQMSIPNVRYMSGDVNSDFSITAADGQRIQRYFVLAEPFDRPGWVFWNAVGSGTVNPPAFTVPVNGASVNGFNILTMCTGDFNGSYRLSGKKGANSNVQMLTGEIRTVPADQEFNLPLIAVNKMEVGAVSLIMRIPSDLAEVKGVTLTGSKSPVTFNVNGDELRIGWYSSTPVSLQAGGELLVLKMKPRRAFTGTEEFKLLMDSNPLNEMADGSFKVLSDPLLKSDIIIASASTKTENLGNSLQLSVYPNPITNSSTLSYTLPKDGQANIYVHNVLGENVATLVNEFKQAGRYSSAVDPGTLPGGIYLITFKLRVNNSEMVQTIRVVVNK